MGISYLKTTFEIIWISETYLHIFTDLFKHFANTTFKHFYKSQSMLRNLLSAVLVILVFGGSAFAQTGQAGLKGKVIDKATGEPLPFVNVVVERDGVQITGGATDFDGKYFIKPLDPGNYTVKASFTGYKPVQINGVVVNANRISFLDVKMTSSIEQLDEFVVVDYKVPLISKDNTTSGQTVTKEDILRMPTRSAAGIAQTVGGVYSKDDGSGGLNIRGARSDANYYFIDGIKVRGSSNLPQSAIEEVNVMVGGVPAQYGDITGGVISITTRGPSSVYFGSVEYVTSGFKIGDQVRGLDPYGYNLLEGSVAGPLIMKKDSAGNKTEPLLGFFLSGNFTSVQDQRPSHIGYWKIRDEVLDDIRENPLQFAPTGTGAFQTTEFLRLDAYEKVRTRQNDASNSFNITGKLDFNTGNNTNLTFGGTYQLTDENTFSFTNSLLNYDAHPETRNNTWRVFGRFTQRFGSKDPAQEEKNSSLIKNAYYTVQADFNQTNFRRWDERHQDNFWNYGYVGQFQAYQDRDYALIDPEAPGDTVAMLYNGTQWGFDQDTIAWTGSAYIQQTFEDTLIGFAPGSVNPEMAAYTESYYDLYGWEGYDEDGNPIFDPNAASSDEERNFFLRRVNNIRGNGGLYNGDLPPSVYGIWNSHAAPWNSYQKSQTNQFRVSAMGSADIKDHAISIGFEYEQRVDRSYSLSPVGLWEIGRLRTNSHIQNLNEFNETFEYRPGETNPYISYERLNASPGEFNPLNDNESQSFFDYNLRNRLGLDTDGTDWIDFNNYGPDVMDLEFFSADELLNNGNNLVSYFGYDAWGNVVSGNPTVDDFFNERDQYGNFTRPIGAFRPIYTAGFIQDKFAFDDLVFNVGLRVDRYDANQSMLRDPYVLFPTVKAGEQEARELAEGGAHPGNIGDNYVVYTDNVENPNRITGYRNGDTWYNSDGIEIDDPSTLTGASGIAPLLVDKENTQSSDISSASFEDYAPQTNFMPRIAFSFPISDEALFFAHYDVLTKRPTTGNRLNMLDYFFLDQIPSSRILNNPSLLPEQTIDYAVGFQQKLTNSSSIKLETFYREMRNQVQVIGYQQAYPRTYQTFGNIDFGTVKGLTVSYDLRRTGNLWMKASYTLQFADGTGSNTTSGVNLVRAGRQNLRNTTPLNYDQRHTIVATIDYRYGAGKDYNGPILFGKQIFSRTGTNIQLTAGSGEPYSAQRAVTGQGFMQPVGASILDGSINGSRLPWQYRLDMRFDKDFELKVGKGDKKKPIMVNVYAQILNVLDVQNIVNVYRATGNADDDGYLTDATFEQDIVSQRDEQAFRELYRMRINSPFNYNLPRRTRLGVLVNF